MRDKGEKNMEKGKIEFEPERAAKNTFRFQYKKVRKHKIGTPYMEKDAFTRKEPKKVKIIVEYKKILGGFRWE